MEYNRQVRFVFAFFGVVSVTVTIGATCVKLSWMEAVLLTIFSYSDSSKGMTSSPQPSSLQLSLLYSDAARDRPKREQDDLDSELLALLLLLLPLVSVKYFLISLSRKMVWRLVWRWLNSSKRCRVWRLNAEFSREVWLWDLIRKKLNPASNLNSYFFWWLWWLQRWVISIL